MMLFIVAGILTKTTEAKFLTLRNFCKEALSSRGMLIRKGKSGKSC